MALLDLTTGALGGAVVFLVGLGVLVLFIEEVRASWAAAVVVAALAVSALLAVLGEMGLGLVVLGLGGAVLANELFEWLTTR